MLHQTCNNLRQILKLNNKFQICKPTPEPNDPIERIRPHPITKLSLIRSRLQIIGRLAVANNACDSDLIVKVDPDQNNPS